MPKMRGQEQNLWNLIKECLGEVLQLFDEPDVTEIMANPDGSVWTDSYSGGMRRRAHMIDAGMRENIILTMASFVGKSCTEENPSVAGSMPVIGARFQGTIYPASDAPGFVIRIPNPVHIELEDYLEGGKISPEQITWLVSGLKEGKNILVAGSTGSGKTTFVNALMGLLRGSSERIVLIEDTPELRCQSPNLYKLRVTRHGVYDYRRAVFDSLRMRPDRIVVGELRDGPAMLEVLKAWNTGHGGGLSTIHANSAAATLSRIEQLLLEKVEHVPKSLVSETVNLIVHLDRQIVREVVAVDRLLDAMGNYRMTTLVHPSLV